MLDGPSWHGQIFTGHWQQSAGGDAAVVEPATGKELGRVGLAGREDVTTSATQAAAAQRDWAAAPLSERAAVLRRAGDAANIDAFTETRWITARAGLPPFPF